MLIAFYTLHWTLLGVGVVNLVRFVLYPLAPAEMPYAWHWLPLSLLCFAAALALQWLRDIREALLPPAAIPAVSEKATGQPIEGER